MKTPRHDKLLIAIFIAAISAPMIAGALGVSNNPTTTMFEGHARPHWAWRPKAMIRAAIDFQQYFNTDFPFREPLITLHAKLKLSLFGVSSSHDVTLGKDGWLFFAGQNVVPDFQCTDPFTTEELAQWTALLTRRQAWLAARHIEFLFYVAPNPQTIYPEHMPDSMWRAANPSRLDQLVAHLRAHSSVNVLDLRPALLEAKKTERVVYKTDTHWNQLGGFVAYEQIGAWMKRRFPQWRTFSRSDFEKVDIPDWHGGLSYFLGAPTAYSETRYELRPRQSSVVLTDGLPLSYDELSDAWFVRRRVVRQSADGELETALFLRDSQFSAPAQFLSRHFRRSVLLWTEQLDPTVVETEHPQVVIFAMAERLLMNPVPVDPPLP